jgi:hypothetical protein
MNVRIPFADKVGDSNETYICQNAQFLQCKASFIYKQQDRDEHFPNWHHSTASRPSHLQTPNPRSKLRKHLRQSPYRHSQRLNNHCNHTARLSHNAALVLSSQAACGAVGNQDGTSWAWLGGGCRSAVRLLGCHHAVVRGGVGEGVGELTRVGHEGGCGCEEGIRGGEIMEGGYGVVAWLVGGVDAVEAVMRGLFGWLLLMRLWVLSLEVVFRALPGCFFRRLLWAGEPRLRLRRLRTHLGFPKTALEQSSSTKFRSLFWSCS